MAQRPPEHLQRILGYTDSVLRRKPFREIGQSLRDLPTYTLPEAARFLGVPGRTMFYWFDGDRNILKPSEYYGRIALLSFSDMAEAYVLALLTQFYDFRLTSLRNIVENARKETPFRRPLIQADLRVLFRNVVIEKPTRKGRPRHMVDLAHGGRNLVFPEFVDQLGKRILKDKHRLPYRLHPWRLIGAGDDSRPVSIDPEIASGRLVVTGTRVPVSILLGKKLKGQSEQQIAKSYHLDVDVVTKALRHIDRPIPKKAA